jgi:hypothetical protein
MIKKFEAFHTNNFFEISKEEYGNRKTSSPGIKIETMLKNLLTDLGCEIVKTDEYCGSIVVFYQKDLINFNINKYVADHGGPFLGIENFELFSSEDKVYKYGVSYNEDDWFYVIEIIDQFGSKSNMTYYKCDQWDGLLSFLNSKDII